MAPRFPARFEWCTLLYLQKENVESVTHSFLTAVGKKEILSLFGIFQTRKPHCLIQLMEQASANSLINEIDIRGYFSSLGKLISKTSSLWHIHQYQFAHDVIKIIIIQTKSNRSRISASAATFYASL